MQILTDGEIVRVKLTETEVKTLKRAQQLVKTIVRSSPEDPPDGLVWVCQRLQDKMISWGDEATDGHQQRAGDIPGP